MNQSTIKSLPVQSRMDLLAMSAVTDSIKLARLSISLDSLAMGVKRLLQQNVQVNQSHPRVLIPMEELVGRLRSARQAAHSLDLPLCIFACTEARTAIALTADTDPRDVKCLSGARTPEGFHVYCGNLDAAISRALVYACYADVVCFGNAVADLSEAARFAAEVKASFPGKKLGFGHNPRPDHPAWSEVGHLTLAAKLRSLGYDYYYTTQLGQVLFPNPPTEGSWMMLNDTGPAKLGGDNSPINSAVLCGTGA